jgi:hypothetical protein
VAVGAGFCAGCGRPASVCAGCSRPLDPPRFCVHCGRKLKVLVSPVRVEASCPEHGTPESTEGGS